ncbi:MAG TPA: RtcB family protein [Flavobacterium sp.]|jgi:tRNA-splicing ligase RtcB
MKTSIKAADLMDVGYQPTESLGLAIKLSNENFPEVPHDEVIGLFKKVKEYPELFLEDEVLAELAAKISEENKVPVDIPIALKEKIHGYKIYGAENIEEGARTQMDIAMKLPITVAGALMPDAHQGYGLPIGGVLATKDAVIPYGVGVDIGCRMALSIYDIPEMHFERNREKYKIKLVNNTKFGAGQGFTGKDRANHRVLENSSFNMNKLTKSLKDKAWTQLGSSGGGNHFVEFGIMEFDQRDDVLGIEKGRYVALLTHSGSRGLGATLAGHYTKLAKDKTKLPKEAANLAYLDMNSQEGQEYWLAMNLAGDYASACHEIIHDKITKAIGANVLAKVENHHNFAWKEIWNGEEVIVHRKGATPAGKGVMGIIPGSMTAPGFLVRGKGEEGAINSASHGAGRQMSRTQAIKSITRTDMRRILADHKVDLIGAGLDEAPMAYKDINLVMASQTDLIDVVAKFIPRIVRMADDGSRED